MNMSLVADSNSQVDQQARADFSEAGVFWVKPYVELGPDPQSGPQLVWFSPLSAKYWQVQTRYTTNSQWATITFQRSAKIDYFGNHVHHFVAQLPSITCVEFRIVLNGCEVFASQLTIPSRSETSFRAVVFGDFADGGSGATAVAQGVYAADPQLIVIAGDLVYEHGKISELRGKFFPAINADSSGHNLGAPLARTRMVVPVIGNHDVGAPKNHEPGANDVTDLFGYFTFWRNPNNGPRLGRRVVEQMVAHDRKGRLLLRKHGDFICRSNYSFDWANTHWTILDANKYMDWSLPQLRDWLRADLSAAVSDFKFVSFHQPGFNSDTEYHVEQRMRAVCDILEEAKVDVVFNGHCHFYQRFKPIRFRPHQLVPASDGTIDGDMTIDQKYDGSGSTLPDGVIYVITGAGGRLVSTESKSHAGNHGPESEVINDTKRSFTRLDVDGLRLEVNQVAIDGEVLDSFIIDKS